MFSIQTEIHIDIWMKHMVALYSIKKSIQGWTECMLSDLQTNAKKFIMNEIFYRRMKWWNNKKHNACKMYWCTIWTNIFLSTQLLMRNQPIYKAHWKSNCKYYCNIVIHVHVYRTIDMLYGVNKIYLQFLLSSNSQYGYRHEQKNKY